MQKMAPKLLLQTNFKYVATEYYSIIRRDLEPAGSMYIDRFCSLRINFI